MLSEVDQSTEIIDFWNDIRTPRFIQHRPVPAGGLSPHGDALGAFSGPGGIVMPSSSWTLSARNLE